MVENGHWNPVESDAKARVYADLIKDGSDGSMVLLKGGLREEALSMPASEFLDLLTRIDNANAKDRAINKLLPDVSILIDLNEDWRQHSDTTDGISSVEMSLARPGKWLGNYRKTTDIVYFSGSRDDETKRRNI